VTPADIKVYVHQLNEVIKTAGADGEIKFTMHVNMARAFRDYLLHHDPDMPPPPLCKALGPLVGDVVMNKKLRRLDQLADKLGPTAILLVGLATQLVRLVERRGRTAPKT
jgi:hypothetical protein